MFDLSGNIALITGASGGIGAAIATALSEEGANLVISDLDEAAGAARAASLKNAVYLRHNVTVESDWEACIAATRDRFGSLEKQFRRDAGNENHRRDVL